ncbi:hypothetical protein PO124_09895 [Bacillus licheniformis]|nr:hypothetical protein [Bacillus licheniformis]
MIKANIPTRIAFLFQALSIQEQLSIWRELKASWKGDMLFLENGSGKPVRLQGNFVSDREIDRVVSHVRRQQEPNYLFEQEQLVRQIRPDLTTMNCFLKRANLPWNKQRQHFKPAAALPHRL